MFNTFQKRELYFSFPCAVQFNQKILHTCKIHNVNVLSSANINDFLLNLDLFVSFCFLKLFICLLYSTSSSNCWFWWSYSSVREKPCFYQEWWKWRKTYFSFDFLQIAPKFRNQTSKILNCSLLFNYELLKLALCIWFQWW